MASPSPTKEAVVNTDNGDRGLERTSRKHQAAMSFQALHDCISM